MTTSTTCAEFFPSDGRHRHIRSAQPVLFASGESDDHAFRKRARTCCGCRGIPKTFQHRLAVSSLVFPEFIQITTPAKVSAALAGNRKLHAGEIDAISLAIEKKADVVLMDEQAGRLTAGSMGLRCIGILGILIQAKSAGLLPKLSPLLVGLESQAGFWIAPTLRRRVLALVNE